MKTMGKVGLNASNTEVIIHGDHPIMGRARLAPFVDEKKPRRMFALFPFQPPGTVNKTINMYDIIPTFLYILGIEHDPPFPFGTPAFSNKTSRVPSSEELTYIASIFGRGVML